jgi:hypothetical protein
VVVNRHGGFVIDGRWTLFDPDRPTTTDDAVTLMNLDMGTEAAAFGIENVRRMIQDYGFPVSKWTRAPELLVYSIRRFAATGIEIYGGCAGAVRASRKSSGQRPNDIVVGKVSRIS